MRKQVQGFLSDEQGATAIEYGLIAALIAVFIIASLTKLSGNMNNTFNTVSSNLTPAAH